MAAGEPNTAKIDATDARLRDRVMDVNSKGVFLGTRAAIPAMREAGGGSIINISSIAGIVALAPGNGRSAAYSASKGSVRLLTKSTAVQYGEEGIRCNSVHPGFIETEMTQPVGRDWGIAQGALNRIGTVDDIAIGVLFLASDESPFITGSEILIDEGWTAQ